MNSAGSPASKRYRVIGMMSGTSADGVDAALIETDGLDEVSPGIDHFRPYQPDERRAILAAYDAARRLDPKAPWPEALVRAEEVVTHAHAEAVTALLDKAGLVASAIDLLGFHGQTVLHDPARQLTLQIGDAQGLARRTGIDVVFDFRSADVAAGGQGAPFVPLYHKARTRHLTPPLVVLNLGGVGNLTYVGSDLELLAFDTGPGNALIDDWVHRHTGAVCDQDGRIAATGRVDEHALKQLLAHPYFAITPPKSLDRNSFPIDAMAHLGLEDGAATLTAFTVHSVRRAFDHLPVCPQRVLVTGGGRHNPVMMAMLAQVLGVDVAPVEAEGLQGDTMEAEAFAYLAARSVMGLALSLPGTTGVPHPMPGGRFVSATAA